MKRSNWLVALSIFAYSITPASSQAAYSDANAADQVTQGNFSVPSWVVVPGAKEYQRPQEIFRTPDQTDTTSNSSGMSSFMNSLPMVAGPGVFTATGTYPLGYGWGLGRGLPYSGWGRGWGGYGNYGVSSWSNGAGAFTSWGRPWGGGWGMGSGIPFIGSGIGYGGYPIGFGGLGGFGGWRGGYLPGGFGGLGFGGLGFGGLGFGGLGYGGYAPGFGGLGGFGGMGALPMYGGYGGWGPGWGYGGMGSGALMMGAFGNHRSGPELGTITPSRVIQTAPSKASGEYYAPSTVDTSASGSYYASQSPSVVMPVEQHKPPRDYWGSSGSGSGSWGSSGSPFPKDLNSVPWAK